ncbi:MAG: archaeosortase/exosortase family protein, partial [Pirellulaceae bacterium]
MTVVDTTQSTRSEATAPLSGRVNWLNALLPAVILLSELPLLVLFFQRLWGSEAYRIFPVVLTVAGMLAYARWPQEVTPLRRRDRWLGYFSLVAGYLAVLAGVALWSPWIAALGSLLTALFLCLYFVRGEALVRFGALWLLLGLLLPLPAPLDMEATAVLQGLAGKAASLWLDALGYNHVLSGQVIHALGLRLVVADGCSPWHSGVMLVLLAAMYIAAVRFPRAPAAMLLLSAVGWSIVANTASLVLRVALHANGTTLAAGSGQTFLAIGILVVILGLMWSTSRFWLCMFAPIAMERREDLPRPVPVVVGSPLLPRQGVVAAVLAFAAVGVAQALPVVRQDGDWGETDQKPARNNLVVNRDAILPLGDRWELADFSLRVDDLSEVRGSAAIAAAEWKLVRGGLTARVRLAYPFRGWRAVSDLHAEEGWEIIKQRGHRSTEAVSASRPGWPDLSPEGTRPADVDSNETGDLPRAIEFEMENPTGDYAYEAIGLLDERGGMIVADLDS